MVKSGRRVLAPGEGRSFFRIPGFDVRRTSAHCLLVVTTQLRRSRSQSAGRIVQSWGRPAGDRHVLRVPAACGTGHRHPISQELGRVLPGMRPPRPACFLTPAERTVTALRAGQTGRFAQNTWHHVRPAGSIPEGGRRRCRREPVLAALRVCAQGPPGRGAPLLTAPLPMNSLWHSRAFRRNLQSPDRQPLGLENPRPSSLPRAINKTRCCRESSRSVRGRAGHQPALKIDSGLR